MTLVFKRLYSDEDFRTAFLYYCDSEKDMPTVKYNDFIDKIYGRIKGSFHDCLLILRDGIIIGTAIAYDYRIYDNHCRIEVFVDDNIIKYNEVVKDFSKYMFAVYPLNVIYVSVTDEEKKNSLIELGFVENACLKEYKYKNGKYIDEYIIRISKG